MKTKLHITGLLLLTLLTISCSNDDYETTEVQNNTLKVLPIDKLKKEVNSSVIDSTTISTPDDDGEPNNPKPPRQ
ncbi:hypothetical protein KHA90_10970 [Flavobacterium psychroterrae]|uniref:Cytochrome C551 n=1 Tax=Flavobacterium psychroterrae TaxID=2133767 RepID=A0ABS5PB39_9FLAO|nr:hypothetical protein [Flavobacterium psychroterrae]MBS7231544.1 hypothetical protein [Flavobacterium psychroterrae]